MMADDLRQALATLNAAAYAAIRAGKDTTAYPDLNRAKLREIARMTDEMVEHPNAIVRSARVTVTPMEGDDR